MTDIIAPGPEALPAWVDDTINLASPRLGSEAVACSNDGFAPMARMLADAPAVFKPGLFDEFGKWMDGWESKRRRDDGYDWCVLRLGVLGMVRGSWPDEGSKTGSSSPAWSSPRRYPASCRRSTFSRIRHSGKGCPEQLSKRC